MLMTRRDAARVLGDALDTIFEQPEVASARDAQAGCGCSP